MTWELRSLKSPMLMYYLVKFIGLASFTVKNNRFHRSSFLCTLYPVTLALSQIIFMSISYVLVLEDTSKIDSKVNKIGSELIHLISLPGTLLILITSIFMRMKIIKVLNKLCIISDEFKSLGIDEDNEKFLENLSVTTVILNVIFIAVFIVNILLEPFWSIFLLIKNCYEEWFYFNTIVIFAQMLFFIRRCFTLVNERLYDVFVPSRHIRLLHHSRIFVVSRKPNQQIQGSEDLTDIQRIRKIGTVHSDLCRLLERTANLFAIPILVISFKFFLTLILLSYREYDLTKNLNQPEATTKTIWQKTVEIVCPGIRMIFTIVELFIIAHASTTTCEQGNVMKSVLYRVWNKFNPTELRCEFLMISTQLLHNKAISVCIFGIIDLDYSYVNKIFCAVVGYLIIMIQIELSQQNPST